MLSVRNGAKALEFYKAAFGAEELFKIENGGGVVATLSVGGAEFWVADESPEHLNYSPETLGGGTTAVMYETVLPLCFRLVQSPRVRPRLNHSRQRL